MVVSKAVKKRMDEAWNREYEEISLVDQDIVVVADVPYLLQMRNITCLTLSHNRIKVLPDAISNCQSLEILNVFNNELVRLPTSICNLAKLRVLNCSVNRLTELPKGFGTCPSLQVLDLKYNQLSRLPGNFFYLKPLRALYLCVNNFQVIPPEIKNLVNLQVLAVRNNSLVSIPKEVGELGKLKELHLQHNQLQVLPPEIGNLDFSNHKRIFRYDNNPWMGDLVFNIAKSELVQQKYMEECLQQEKQAEPFQQRGYMHIAAYLRSDAYKTIYENIQQGRVSAPTTVQEDTSNQEESDAGDDPQDALGTITE